MAGAATVDGNLVLEVLEELVRIDSRNPELVPGAPGEEAIARYLARSLQELGLEVHIQEVVPGRPNVVGVLRGKQRGAPSLMWNGHLDTVGTAGMGDPFRPRREGGRLFGRGAYDMKAGLAAAVGALAALQAAGGPPGDVIFAGVCDEEYASRGTQALVQDFRSDAAMVLEPTALGVGICQKGFLWAQVTVKGRAAHGSNYREGIDAIVRMGHFLVALDTYQGRVLAAREHRYLGYPSVHASLIEGGRELSTYPDLCLLKLERRTLPGETDEAVMDELRALARQVAGEDPGQEVQVEFLLSRPPYEISPEEPVVRALRAAYLRVGGRESQYTGSLPWTDAALLGQAGIPCLIFGPGGAGAHAAEEYVYAEETVQAAQVLAEAAVVFGSWRGHGTEGR